MSPLSSPPSSSQSRVLRRRTRLSQSEVLTPRAIRWSVLIKHPYISRVKWGTRFRCLLFAH
eukprot:scaffold42254_cov65-Phaeocystis_antarctica.AAC.1